MSVNNTEFGDDGSYYARDLPHVSEAIDRLAAYEDTGLTPEEVAALAKVKADGRLVVLDTAPQDEYGGLKRKYIVFKSDTGEPVENCFVLRPEIDPAAVIALEAYAKATENKELAADILNWVGDSGRSVRLPCKVGENTVPVRAASSGQPPISPEQQSADTSNLSKSHADQ